MEQPIFDPIADYAAQANEAMAARNQKGTELGKDDFMMMLVAKLENQDPLNPTADNTLYADATTTNHGADNDVRVGTGNPGSAPSRHALLRFDLSTIPAGATVTSARLRLNAYSRQGSAAFDLEAHRVDQDWPERASSCAFAVAKSIGAPDFTVPVTSALAVMVAPLGCTALPETVSLLRFPVPAPRTAPPPSPWPMGQPPGCAGPPGQRAPRRSPRRRAARPRALAAPDPRRSPRAPRAPEPGP